MLKRYGFSVAPIIMGLILGEMVESTFKQSMIIFDHNWAGFLNRPIVLVFIALTALSIASPVIGRTLRRRRGTETPA